MLMEVFLIMLLRCNSQQEAEEKAKADINHDKVYVYPVKWYKDFNGNLYKDLST